MHLKRWDIALTTLIGFVVFLRLDAVETITFSYDYFAYQAWLEDLAELSWQELYDLAGETFPYVTLRAFTLVEVGFAVLAKLALELFDPRSAFALCAALSVAVRSALMRSFGLGWGMVLLVQAFALTLLEANAIRAGMALTLCMLGLRLWLGQRQLVSLFILLASCLVHLQAVAYVGPFLLFIFSGRMLEGRIGHKLALIGATCMGVAGVVAISHVAVINEIVALAKLQDYRRETAPAGLTIVAMLTLLFVCMVAAGFVLVRARLAGANATEYFWFAAFLACVPSIVVYLFVTDAGATPARLWQFVLVILATVPVAHWLAPSLWRMSMKVVLLVLFAAVNINAVIRYPLSNFFSPPLPETVFTPSAWAY